MLEGGFGKSITAERALLVRLVTARGTVGQLCDDDEFMGLVKGSGVQLAAETCLPVRETGPGMRLGGGQMEQLRSEAELSGANIVILNQSITPPHERELEKRLGRPIIDRTSLILDIFAQRARSYEGKLQVELAQLRHISTRLIRGWTHLERQKGGIGLRGPGETQLETDRRLLRKRIKTIQQKLSGVRRSRAENRSGRRGAMPQVSIIGYSNVGKSTIFNWLTGASGYVANKPFATLDPLLRRCHIDAGREVLLADTVGFVRDLPEQLVNAFRATLEESCEANLLLHVVDCSDPLRHERVAQVERIMQDIGVKDVPRVIVNNCIDKTNGIEPGSEGGVVFVSARQKLGKEHLLRAMSTAMWGERKKFKVRVPDESSAAAMALLRHGAVPVADGGKMLQLDVERGWLEDLCYRTGATLCE